MTLSYWVISKQILGIVAPGPLHLLMSRVGFYSAIFILGIFFLSIFIRMVHPIVSPMRVMPMAPFRVLNIFWVLPSYCPVFLVAVYFVMTSPLIRLIISPSLLLWRSTSHRSTDLLADCHLGFSASSSPTFSRPEQTALLWSIHLFLPRLSLVCHIVCEIPLWLTWDSKLFHVFYALQLLA